MTKLTNFENVADHKKGSCPVYGKICNNFRNKGHFAKCCTKKKGTHSLNQEYSDNTAQYDSLSDCEVLFIGTINVQNSSSNYNGDINFENTKKNSFTEHNSNSQLFNDNLNVTDQ